MRLIYFIILLALAGCLSSKNMDKQLAKINEAHPEKIASLCASVFPPITRVDTLLIDTSIELTYPIIDTIVDLDTICLEKPLPAKIIRKRIIQVKYDTKFVEVIKHVEDSAKVKLCLNENAKLNAKIGEINKAYGTLKSLLWLLILLILALAYSLVKKKNKKG